MLIAAGVLSLAIWIYLVFARGGFWRINPAVPARQDSGDEGPVKIAVIIPARNEADVVGRAVRSFRQKMGAHQTHIFLVDDSSTDATAEAARAAAIAAERAQD